MKHIQSLSVAFMLSMCLSSLGQTQKGYVKTLGRPNQKGTALSGVTIRLKGAHNAVLSGTDGTFSMSMTGKKNGESYSLQQVQKTGYELNDNATIGRQYAFSEKVPLTIVMVSKQQLQENKLRIENAAYKEAERKYRQKSALLEKQKEQNIITEENYREQINKLQKSLSKYQSLIDDLAEHYAHTDYDELDAKEYEINQCIEKGELERADSILQQMGIYKRIDNITKRLEAGTSLMQNAQKEMSAVLKQQEKDAEYLYQLYTISLGRFDNDKAKFYIETRAELDSTNVEWQLDAGQFNSEFLANYDEALGFLTRGLRHAISQYGEQSELSARSYYYIASYIYFEKKEINPALDYFQKAFDIREKLYDGFHPLIAMNYAGMGSILSIKGDFQKAMEYQEKALEIRKQVLPYMHNDMAMSYFNIGYIETCTGKFKEGLEDMQKAIDILKELYGEQFIHVADSYHNMGYIYFMIGDYDKGKEFLNKGYTIRKNLFGENHPDVAESLNGLGNIYLTMGDYEKATDYFHRALTIRLNVFGENNAMVATSYNNIATAFSYMGDLANTLEYYKKSLEIGQNTLGNRHIDVGVSYLNIANTYHKMKDYDKALENVNIALDIFNSSLGDNDVKVAQCYNLLGAIYTDINQFDKAIENHKRSLNIRKSVLGEKHHDIFISYNNIGYTYYKKEMYKEAIEFFNIALHGFIETLGTKHPQLKTTINSINSVYQAYLEKNPNDKKMQQAYQEFKDTYIKEE